MSAVPDEGIVLATVTIVKVWTDDGDETVHYSAVDEAGEPLRLVETLGLLTLTTDMAIRTAEDG